MNSQSPAATVATPTPARIFLLDDQFMIRRSLTMLFDAVPDLKVCGEAATVAEARSKIAHLQPDLALMDLMLAEEETFDLVGELRHRMPGLRIVVFSTHRESAYVVRARKAGADEYLFKDHGPQKILQAIRTLLHKRSHIGAEESSLILAPSEVPSSPLG